MSFVQIHHIIPHLRHIHARSVLANLPYKTGQPPASTIYIRQEGLACWHIWVTKQKQQHEPFSALHIKDLSMENAHKKPGRTEGFKPTGLLAPPQRIILNYHSNPLIKITDLTSRIDDFLTHLAAVEQYAALTSLSKKAERQVNIRELQFNESISHHKQVHN